jgi:O-antigen ligase
MNGMSARIERVLWIGCPVLMFAVMFGRLPAFVNNGMGLVGIALVAAALSSERPALPRWPLFAPIVAWAAWSLASVGWSVSPHESLHAWLDEIVYPLLSFWGFWLFGTRERHPERYTLAVWIACVLLAAISVHYWGQLQPPTLDTFPLRFYARVGHTSTLALFATTLFCAFMVAKPRWLWRWVGVVGVVLGLFIGLATLNRFFWPVAGLTLLVALYPLYRRHMLLAAVAVAVLGVGAVATLELSAQMRLKNSAPALAASRDVSVGGMEVYVPHGFTALGDTLSSDTRPKLWAFYEEVGARHAWLGVGFGKPLPGIAYRNEIPPSLLEAEPQALTHAHNLFLNTWLQTGWIGLVLEALLLLALASCFWRMRRDAPWIAAGGLALVVGMVAKNSVDDFMWQTTILAFWSFAGLLLGYGERVAGVPRAQPAGRGLK